MNGNDGNDGNEGDGESLYSIGELSAEFGISTRAIRFYETKGLIKPRRVGTRRVFDRRDRVRLSLITRGKRLGFSLGEIAEYLALYDVDPSQTTQISHLLRKIERSIADLKQRHADIEKTLNELRDVRRQCLKALNK